jgi:T-complex protein 1 subunit gamma
MSQFNIFQEKTKRETGKKAQHGNIAAAKVRLALTGSSCGLQRFSGSHSMLTNPTMQAVADIIRSTLGPRSMLKMLLDPNGGAFRSFTCARPARPVQA